MQDFFVRKKTPKFLVQEQKSSLNLYPGILYMLLAQGYNFVLTLPVFLLHTVPWWKLSFTLSNGSTTSSVLLSLEFCQLVFCWKGTLEENKDCSWKKNSRNKTTPARLCICILWKWKAIYLFQWFFFRLRSYMRELGQWHHGEGFGLQRMLENTGMQDARGKCWEG